VEGEGRLDLISNLRERKKERKKEERRGDLG